jgi:hypothetical protein
LKVQVPTTSGEIPALFYIYPFGKFPFIYKPDLYFFDPNKEGRSVMYCFYTEMMVSSCVDISDSKFPDS